MSGKSNLEKESLFKCGQTEIDRANQCINMLVKGEERFNFKKLTNL